MPRRNVTRNNETEPRPDGLGLNLVMTPYGELFTVRLGDGDPPYYWEVAMSMAGIHDRGARARCKAELAQVGSFGTGGPDRFDTGRWHIERILEQHGGVCPSAVRLPKLDFKIVQYEGCSYYEAMALLADLDDKPGSRYVSLMDAYHGLTSNPAYNKGDMLATVLTGKLNAWRDDAILQLPQAITYALTIIPLWRKAALEWLAPHRRTWVPDYLKRNPHVMSLARLAAVEVPGIPTWLQHI